MASWDTESNWDRRVTELVWPVSLERRRATQSPPNPHSFPASLERRDAPALETSPPRDVAPDAFTPRENIAPSDPWGNAR